MKGIEALKCLERIGIAKNCSCLICEFEAKKQSNISIYIAEQKKPYQ